VIDWNSKKVDDDQVESRVLYRARPPSSNLTVSTKTTYNQSEQACSETAAQSPEARSLVPWVQADSADHPATDDTHVHLHGHGLRADGGAASCAKETFGVIDCRACVADSRELLLRAAAESDKAAMEGLITLVEEAGGGGLPQDDLSVSSIAHSDYSAVSLFTDYRERYTACIATRNRPSRGPAFHPRRLCPVSSRLCQPCIKLDCRAQQCASHPSTSTSVAGHLGKTNI
jgi:hypothetical protein